MKNEEVRNLLLMKRGALGDVLLTTPLIRSLRHRFPHATIHYMTGSWSYPALVGNTDIDAIIQFQDDSNLIFLAWHMLPGILRAWWHGYDLAISLDKAWQIGFLARMLGKYSVGFNRSGAGYMLHDAVLYASGEDSSACHDVESYLALGDRLGCNTRNMGMVFVPSSKDYEFAREALGGFTGPIVALCPGGAKNPYQVMQSRKWPIDRYALLARTLLSRGISVVLLGGKDDMRDADLIVKHCDTSEFLISFVGQVSLGQSGALLSLSRVSVCHDTALLHLSSAMKIPVVALFGPTNPKQKEPLSSGSITIWDSAPCPNCGKIVCYVENQEPDPKCALRMQRISVSAVLDSVHFILNT